MRAIYRLVKEENYTDVYIHGNSAMMFLEAVPSKLAGAKRVITHCHNTSTDYPLVHYIVKPFFNRAVDVKIACSEAAGKWAYCGKNIQIIKNGIDLNRFEFDNNIRGQYRKKLGWEKNIIIGHVGRFTPQKNHFFLIDIFEKLYLRDKRMRLLLIGDGVLKADVQKYVEEKRLGEFVQFLGSINNTSDYYNAMDVFLLPSLFEGLGIVAIEAQANGMPCFLSENCPREAFVTSNAQAVPSKNDSNDWSDRILALREYNRQDTVTMMRAAGWDKHEMMEKIRFLLTLS